jgi:serine/threonine-protein kinase
VRITDFGLAGLLKDSDGAELRVGTPGYMAPEQISGSRTSVKSDLYSLGLVLYELFTGRRAFEADTPAELARQQQEWFPTSPSALVQNLDPAVERIILRCLEQDARDRPTSAPAVAAALPGGDPLAEALQNDETPSPELVAEIEVKAGLRPAVAWSCLAGFALMLAAGAWLGQRSRFLPHLPLDKPKGYLAERAREIARGLSYRDVPTDQAFGYAPNWDYLNHVSDPERFSERRGDLANAQPSAIRFWYRQSPEYLVPANYDVTRTDPASALSGMVGVGLDTQGRLTSFEAVPPANLEDWPTGARPDWEMLLSEAGLDVNALEPAEPRWNPPVYADSRVAWHGTYSDARDVSIRVEAAALGGRPVFFKVVEPWNAAARAPDSKRNVWSRINSITTIFLFLPALLGGALLARRNLRLGRGDQKGAFRLGGFMFALWLVFGILRSDHVADLPEFWILLRALAMAFLFFGLFWILYVALEPYVRRFWPRMLVSWVRLLDGRFRDPLVARHLLIGGLFGCSALFIAHAGTLMLQGQGQPAWGPGALGLQLSSLASFRYTLAGTLDLLDFAVTTSLEILVLLVLLRMVLRNRWVAVAGVYLVVTALFAWPQDARLAHAVVVALGLAILLRFGLLPMLAGLFVFVLLGNFLVSLDPASAFAASSWFAVAIVVVLTGYGFHYSLERRADSKAAHAHSV